ncbi:unnamed protein product [Cuscuta campestris]|uniref:Small ribosomal subunit protein uS17c n=1 Tax=Cuscuta campestris TaxID=132261 RepID=A0A484KQL1_9ASTE|nr:unnamed protein product [Cuscuta campestris]
MSLAPHLLQLPISQFKSLNLTSTFLHGASSLPHHLSNPTSSSPSPRASAFAPAIRAMRSMQGRVVCTANDKTVAVEVVRLVPHPKYQRRVRKKKRFQAHDPLNQFKVGDLVQLEKSRPISKTKAFVAIASPPRNQSKRKEEGESQELGLPLESEEILA